MKQIASVPNLAGSAFAAAASGLPEPFIASPAPSSTLISPTAAFRLDPNTGNNVTDWQLLFGSTVGGDEHDTVTPDYDAKGVMVGLVTGLPVDGSTVYVRLRWKIDGAASWSHSDHVYTAVTANTPTFAQDQDIAPVNQNMAVGTALGVLDVSSNSPYGINNLGSSPAGLPVGVRADADGVFREVFVNADPSEVAPGDYTMQFDSSSAGGSDSITLTIPVVAGLLQPQFDAPVTLTLDAADLQAGDVLWTFTAENTDQRNTAITQGSVEDDGTSVKGSMALGFDVFMESGRGMTWNLAANQIIVDNLATFLAQFPDDEGTAWVSLSNRVGRTVGGEELQAVNSSQITIKLSREEPSNTTPPSISGTLKSGETITLDYGEWDGLPDGYSGFTSQVYLDGNPVSGATSNTYVLSSEDVEAELLEWEVSATNSEGTTSVRVEFGPVEPVTPASNPDFTIPTPVAVDNITATSARFHLAPVDSSGNPINTVAHPVEWDTDDQFPSPTVAPEYSVAHPSHAYTLQGLPAHDEIFVRATLTGPNAAGEDGQGVSKQVLASVQLTPAPAPTPTPAPTTDFTMPSGLTLADAGLANPAIQSLSPSTLSASLATWPPFASDPGGNGHHYRFQPAAGQDIVYDFTAAVADKPVHIVGGKSVRLIGLEASPQNKFQVAGRQFETMPLRRILHIQQQDVTWVEGAYLNGLGAEGDHISVRNHGDTAGEAGFAEAASDRKIYVLNSHIRGAEGRDAGEHGDLMQIQGQDIAALVHLENCEFYTAYEGFVWEGKPDYGPGTAKRWHGTKHLVMRNVLIAVDDDHIGSDNKFYGFIGFECQTYDIRDLWVDLSGAPAGAWDAATKSGFGVRVVGANAPTTGFWTNGPVNADYLDFTSAEAVTKNWNWTIDGTNWIRGGGAGVAPPSIAPIASVGSNYISPF